MKSYEIQVYKYLRDVPLPLKSERILEDIDFDESMIPRTGEYIVATNFKGTVAEVVHIFKENTHIVQIYCREEY